MSSNETPLLYLRWGPSLFILCISDQVGRELRREADQAAIVLQRNWRGYRVRAGLHQRVTKTTQIRAAVKIQRYVSSKMFVL